jgi:hypothetical protein
MTREPEERPRDGKTVSVELYEGLVDQKTGRCVFFSSPVPSTKSVPFSADMSSYDENMRNVTAFERAYVFPHGVTAIATTSTKFGIMSKDIIGAHILLD